MTYKKINQLTEITTPDNNDVLIIDDVSAGETKKITFQNLSQCITTALSQSITASFAVENSARAEAIATANANLSFNLTGLVGNAISEVKASESLARSELSGSINKSITNLSQSIVNNFNTNILNLSQSFSQSLSMQITAMSESITKEYINAITNISQSLSQSLTNYAFTIVSNLSQSISQTFISETVLRNAAISEATSSLAPITYVNNYLNIEAAARSNAISGISASFVISITNLSQSITQSIAAEASERNVVISNVSSSLKAAVTALSQSVTASLASEIIDRTNAINAAVAGLASISYVNSAVSGISLPVPGGSFGQIQYNNSGNFGGVPNLTWNGSNLFVTGAFKGNIEGSATTAAGLSTTRYFISLNGTANGLITNIGSMYIPATVTVTTRSLAYIGGSTVSEVAILKLIPINSITVSASWVVTGTLTNVSLSNPVTLGPGWYDLTLETGTASQNAFGRGLYLTSGDI